MKLQDFKNLQPGDRVILNNGREAEIREIRRGMTGKYIAMLSYPDTIIWDFKTSRQVRGLKDE